MSNSRIGLMSILCLCVSMVYGQTIIYVKKGATGSGNGTSWANAYPELSTALTAASAIPGSKEIWVAAGEYKPTSTLDRSISLVVTSGMFLYGGFVGNETSKESRNWRLNRTVLSGDLGKQFDYDDNSSHVVRLLNTASSDGLDGFIIGYGNASHSEDYGAGGGVLMVSGTSPRFTNLIFEHNRGSGSAAVFIAGGTQSEAAPIFKDCEFHSNVSLVFGAILVSGPVDKKTIFINCVFTGNSGSTSSVCGSVGNTDFINCSIAYNQGRPFFNGVKLGIENSIIWKNFFGDFENHTYIDPIQDAGNELVVTNNIIQGGYGSPSDNNIDADPLFVREPSFIGVYPRTSILPVSSTDPKYENQLEFNGPHMWGPWPYYAFRDHDYNKTYMVGRHLQILDYGNLTDNKPASTVYEDVYFPRTQRPDRSFHTASNSIYIASHYTGVVSVNRQTAARTFLDIAAGETGDFQSLHPNDLIVDNTNNLLYCPVFTEPSKTFYGLLELNLTTQAKRWIRSDTSPVSISGGVVNWNDDGYWGGLKIFLDEQSNVLYFSTGNGVWWWNRTTNATGLYNTSGGMPLVVNNPQLPSNLTTGIYVDNTENKLYIGTHQGLFVWNRGNNTSRVYNTSNSKLIHNLINTIDKNDERHLVYVACEDGALFILNSQTGEERLVTRDAGSDTHPQFMDVSAASAFYDEVDKKLYVSADHPTGGTWVADYNNLVPDYGDLRLQASSPAIDKGNHSALPSFVTTDMDGQPRFVDYASIAGANSLDLGAYERPFTEDDAPPAPIPVNLNMNYILSYTTRKAGIHDVGMIDDYVTRDVNRAIQYFDGLGRPLQSIAIQGSPTKKDIITPVVLDEFGREPRKYLPFVKANDGVYEPHDNIIDAGEYTGVAADFYSGGIDPTVEPDAKPYSETMFEPSPLNRPLKDYGPGAAWSSQGSDKPITHHYLINVHSTDPESTEGEAIIAWQLDNQGVPVPAAPVTNYVESGGYYSSGQLSIKATVDEQGHAAREYTNKQGQIILKRIQAVSSSPGLNNPDHWASTYYIYDDLGNLVYVLQPEGYKQYLSLGQ